jgi:hypothetical protein
MEHLPPIFDFDWNEGCQNYFLTAQIELRRGSPGHVHDDYETALQQIHRLEQ